MKLRCLVLAFAFLFFGVSVVPMLAQAPPSGGGLVSGSSKISANSRENSNRTNGLRSRFSGVLQPIFLATPTYEVNGSGARSVVPADVNQDGAQDLVVTNNCDALCASGSVDVLLGVGDGTFQPAVSYDSGGFGTSSAAVGDLNGDGLPDVAVANTCAGDCTNGSVGVLLGIGNGAFAPVASYGSGGPSSDSVAVADVNQDGTTDLIVLNQGDSSVGILLGNGDGTFQPAVIYGAAGQAATSLAVADLNGDGKPDLVVASSLNSNYFLNGSVSVLLGNGNGTFQAAVPYDAGGQSTSSVAAADVNGDGKPDVLLANGAGSISVLLGNGDGTLQASLNSDSGAPAVSVAVADMNGDSKPDFLVATGVGLANVLLGNGDGTFQPGVGYGSGGLRAISVVNPLA